MRGAVSLAVALALPMTTDTGGGFPHRDLIVFLTFSVIFFTLVVQGLSLPALIRRLGVRDDAADADEEIRARLGRVLWIVSRGGPYQDGREGERCSVVAGGLVVAGGKAAPVLEAVEAAFHDIAPPVDGAVEAVGPSALAAAPASVGQLVIAFRGSSL